MFLCEYSTARMSLQNPQSHCIALNYDHEGESVNRIVRNLYDRGCSIEYY